ncbi:MAG: glycosyltransferase family 39 protein, partial [Planctomycetaceae bacterium]|nr:glycosyltransferase family 39 protein [Planctomycetaceae bacterium]
MTTSPHVTRKSDWQAAILMLMLAITAVVSRPLLPVDETRYMGVAWEMHQSGDWLVSHRNGEPYSDKPPLLFWLINLIWQVTGVAEYPARLVSPLAAVLCVLLTGQLARKLWPQRPDVGRCAPFIHVSLFLWMFFSPVTMFDMLLTLFTLLTLSAVLDAAAGRGWRAWLWAGVVIGLGILAKGPVILVHTLPVTLAAPWWHPDIRLRLIRWYGGVLAALGIAASIGLSWALPSAHSGGEEYAQDLLWGQTAGRVHDSFAHQEPWWFYLPVLPLVLLPWVSVRKLWSSPVAVLSDPGNRFVIGWLGGTLLILSLVSGKQAYYLLPALPAFALLAASRFTTVNAEDPAGGFQPRDTGLLRWTGLLVALLPLLFNHVALFRRLRLDGLVSDWTVVPLFGVAIVLCRPAWRQPHRPVSSAVREIAVANVVFVCVLVAGLRS